METQPQAAYLAFVSRFRSKLNYFMRTIHEISHHIVSLEETLCNRFIPAITGRHICNDTDSKLLSLPTRFGGIAIPILYEQAAVKYSNSGKLMAQLAPLIKNQISNIQSTRLKSK